MYVYILYMCMHTYTYVNFTCTYCISFNASCGYYFFRTLCSRGYKSRAGTILLAWLAFTHAHVRYTCAYNSSVGIITLNANIRAGTIQGQEEIKCGNYSRKYSMYMTKSNLLHDPLIAWCTLALNLKECRDTTCCRCQLPGAAWLVLDVAGCNSDVVQR